MNTERAVLALQNTLITRMHSIRMRTARSISRLGGSTSHNPPPQEQAPLEQAPPGAGTPQEQAPPWSRHPLG